jgi:hypothetical protein
MAGLALDVLLYDNDLATHCLRHCYCRDYDDDWINQEQLEAKKKKGSTTRPISTQRIDEVAPRPPIISNQRDLGIEQGRVKFGIGRAARLWTGENTNPAVRAPWERRPQTPTFNANGNVRAMFAVRRVDMA